ncbi:hypothetical protein G3O06_07110 [Burkholderia sp. Ac-20345]|uniref:hypothetical protein n=1 Tax=Burkholderia sp. Ac-20345 TaxID=2703891 RepID=UPI00197BA9BC|nr:hypothetical protein [Burkholderia sp. Ac-20345]MBN3777327.1 hypothetical protein [Burkholderia sp. Ac-20345]
MSSVIATLKRRGTARRRAATSPLPAIRYATRLIRDAPGRFDAVEIHGVRQFPDAADPTRSCCEVDDDNPSFFSVYLHFVAGGVVCCADLPTHPDAVHCARVIARRHRWPVYDFYPATQTRPSDKHVEHRRQATSR